MQRRTRAYTSSEAAVPLMGRLPGAAQGRRAVQSTRAFVRERNAR